MSLSSLVPGVARRTVVVAAVVVGGLTAYATAAASAQPTSARPVAGADVESSNAALVRTAYAEFFGEGRTERYDRFFAEDLIQHDPTIADGRAGLVAHVRAQRDASPAPVVTVKRLLADGDLVAAHTHVSPTPDDEASGRATVELYRLAGGRIVEHWGVAQDVVAPTASGNSMFSDVYRYPGAVPEVSPAVEDSNKQLILKAWAAVFSARDFSVLDRYWAGENYLQHNPRVPNGTGGLRGFLGSLPPSVSQNRFALADGDLVLTINQSVATSADLTSDAAGTVVADIYRVVDHRVVEHWDVMQPVPATSANDNSMLSELYQPR